MDVDGSIVDFVTNVFFELGVLHALTHERRQSTLVKIEATCCLQISRAKPKG